MAGQPRVVPPLGGQPESGQSADAVFPAERKLAGKSKSRIRDEAPRRRNPGYTILQYLILLAVAFVLGLLVWELISRGSEPSSAGPATVLPGVGQVQGMLSTWLR